MNGPSKRERYTFSLNVPLILGERLQFNVGQWTMVTFHPIMMLANVPVGQFVQFDSITVDSKELLYDKIGPEHYPCWNGLHTKMITATMAHGVHTRGVYSGLVPDGYSKGCEFLLCLTFQGPRRLTLIERLKRWANERWLS
jgi:hypothetical protein